MGKVLRITKPDRTRHYVPVSSKAFQEQHNSLQHQGKKSLIEEVEESEIDLEADKKFKAEGVTATVVVDTAKDEKIAELEAKLKALEDAKEPAKEEAKKDAKPAKEEAKK